MSVEPRRAPGLPPEDGAARFVRRLGTIYAVIGVLLFGALLLYFLQFAGRVSVDFFDSYEYLNNAKSIAGTGFTYVTRRPPTAALLYAPLMLPSRFFPGLRWLELTAPCIAAVFIALSAIFVLFLILKRTVPPWAVWLTLPFIALNRILMHYTPFPLGDFPGMLFAALAVYFYLTAGNKEEKKFLLLSGICAGLSAAAKYHNGVLCPALMAAGFAWHIPVVPAGERMKAFRGLCAKYAVFLALAPAAAFISANLLAYSGIHSAGFPEKVEMLARAVFRGFRSSSVQFMTDPWNEYLVYMWMVIPALLWLPMIAGIRSSLVRRTRADLVMLGLFLVYFLALSFLFGHREARYMLPLFIPVYYFIAAGTAELWKYFGGPLSRGYAVRAVFSLCAALALFSASRSALKEIKLFNGPFFYTPWEKDVSVKIAGPSEEKYTVFWAGDFLPLRPPDYFFHRNEEYYSVFHFAPHVVYFYTGRMPQALPFVWGDFHSSMDPALRTQPIEDGDRVACVLPWDHGNLYLARAGLKYLPRERLPKNVIIVQRMADAGRPAQTLYVRRPQAAGRDFFYLVYWLGKTRGLYSEAKEGLCQVFEFQMEKIPVP